MLIPPCRSLRERQRASRPFPGISYPPHLVDVLPHPLPQPLQVHPPAGARGKLRWDNLGAEPAALQTGQPPSRLARRPARRYHTQTRPPSFPSCFPSLPPRNSAPSASFRDRATVPPSPIASFRDVSLQSTPRCISYGALHRSSEEKVCLFVSIRAAIDPTALRFPPSAAVALG